MTDWENRSVADAVRMGMVVEGEAAIGRRYLQIPQVKYEKSGKRYRPVIIGRQEIYVLEHLWQHGPCNDHSMVKHEHWTSHQLGATRVTLMCAGLVDREGWQEGGFRHYLSLDGVLLVQQIRREMAVGVRALA